MRTESVPYPGDNPVRHLTAGFTFDPSRSIDRGAWAIAVGYAVAGGTAPHLAPNALNVPAVDPDGDQIYMLELGEVLDLLDPEDVQRALHGALAAAAAAAEAMRVNVAAAERLIDAARTLTPNGAAR